MGYLGWNVYRTSAAHSVPRVQRRRSADVWTSVWSVPTSQLRITGRKRNRYLLSPPFVSRSIFTRREIRPICHCPMSIRQFYISFRHIGVGWTPPIAVVVIVWGETDNTISSWVYRLNRPKVGIIRRTFSLSNQKNHPKMSSNRRNVAL